jgi:3-dehydroquinate dehydratase/shikimate dehydrogenase
MICVSIGRGRHRHMIAEHKHLVENGIRLVELRLDYIQGEVQVRRLLRDRPCPVIVTCRRKSDGGRWEHSEEARQTLKISTSPFPSARRQSLSPRGLSRKSEHSLPLL